MSETLLPCPFCGSTPVTTPSGERGRGLMIECTGSDCVNPHISFYGHQDAIRLWNRRVPTPAVSSEERRP